MDLEIIAYSDLLQGANPTIESKVRSALFNTGILGVRAVPQFEAVSRSYIEAARQFSALDESLKKQYAPNRDAGETEGYELGAEWFKTEEGEWRIKGAPIYRLE
jgi:isopenicillin N synthase-like dioxygenase